MNKFTNTSMPEKSQSLSTEQSRSSNRLPRSTDVKLTTKLHGVPHQWQCPSIDGPEGRAPVHFVCTQRADLKTNLLRTPRTSSWSRVYFSLLINSPVELDMRFTNWLESVLEWSSAGQCHTIMVLLFAPTWIIVLTISTQASWSEVRVSPRT